MKVSPQALKGKYLLFIFSMVVIIIATHAFDEVGWVLAILGIIVLILEFVYIFLPALQRLSAVNRKLITLQSNLEESELQYRELVEGALDIIYELNSNGEFTYVNELMEDMSGYTRSELIGKPYLELIHPEDRSYATEFYRAQLKAGKENSYLEFRMIGKNNQVAWIGQNVRYFYDGSWVSKVRVVARDITQGRHAQLALQQLKEAAERSTRAKSQFLSMMSHEIRTPMNAIIGLTNLLMEQNPTREQLENLKLLRFSGENLLTIINDILDFSKIEAQKIQLEAISFDLRRLIDRTIRIHRAAATDKKITLTCSIDDALPDYLAGDPVRLIQIITNLISNAIKFTQSGGVSLAVNHVETSAEEVSLRLTVTDTGVGIPQDKLSSIFESFSQADETTTRNYGGTGLGLAITKKLVELMNGSIRVESTPGKGSVFTVLLTLIVGSKPEEELESAAIAIKPGARILLAEDNRTNQLVVIGFLNKWNIQVTIAQNGREALQLITSKEFDLILMDLQMPEMNGYEAAIAIRNLPEEYFKTIPIIALTASAMVEIREKVLVSGMNDFLSKPFQPQHLKQLLGKYMPGGPADMLVEELTIQHVAQDDLEFYQSLLQAALNNLEELQRSFEHALVSHDGTRFHAAAHKCKMTLNFLNASKLSATVEEISAILRNSDRAIVPNELVMEFREQVQVVVKHTRVQLKS